MPTFSEALQTQIQEWGEDIQSATVEDIAAMIRTAQIEALHGAKRIRVTLEGTQESVRLVAAMLHEVFQVIDEMPDQPDPDRGFVFRQLMLEGVKAALPSSDPPASAPEAASLPAVMDRSGRPTYPTRLLREALSSVAQGLLDFPIDTEGRRLFTGAYPQTFKDGLGHLSAHFLLAGQIIADALEYWRILSRPLKDWPEMPAELCFDETLIDHEGHTTPLTDRLARGDFSRG